MTIMGYEMIGVRIFYVDIKKEEVINTIKIYFNNQISSRLGELDNRKNKSYIDLIIGALVIIMGIALLGST